MKNSTTKIDVTLQFRELGNWLKEQVLSTAPGEVTETLELLCEYLEVASASTASGRALKRNFLRALGILPKTERSKKAGLGSGRALSIVEKRKLCKRLLAEIARDKSLSREVRHTKAKGEQLEHSLDLNESLESDLADFEPDFDENLEKGFGAQGPSEASCCPCPEQEGLVGQAEEVGYICNREERCELSAEEIGSIKSGPSDSISIVEKESERIGFQIVAESIKVKTQTAFSRTTGASVRASTEHIGPRGKKVTWDGLVSLMTMMVGYLIPANRISSMLGAVGSYFTRARCSELLQYTGRRLLAIHIHHIEMLSRAQVLHTDDTGSRCPEATRAREKEGLEGENTPWRHWYQKEDLISALRPEKNTSEPQNKKIPAPPPRQDEELYRHVAWELGFLNRNKDGSPRKRLRTTVVIGKEEQTDMRSFVVLYHTHFGEAGDVIGRILLKKARARHGATARSAQKPKVWVVSDLLATNRAADPRIHDAFEVLTSGCMHHARRNFKLNEEEDSFGCGRVVAAFDCMAAFEKEVTQRGRRRENVLATRKTIARLWDYVYQISESLASKWPEGHPVGRAARYVLGNYADLTRYLNEPHLPDNNSLSERMLRPERLMERSSLFRWSLEGRCAWNIVRGVYQTCQLNGVNFRSYLDWLLRTPETAVTAAPEKYTPKAFAAQQTP